MPYTLEIANLNRSHVQWQFNALFSFSVREHNIKGIPCSRLCGAMGFEDVLIAQVSVVPLAQKSKRSETI